MNKKILLAIFIPVILMVTPLCTRAEETLAAEGNVMIETIRIIGNTYTQSEVLMSFLSELRQGQTYQKDHLERILRRVEERLRNTSWFYQADVYLVPRKETGKVNVVVTVTEGFLYRFWGGYVFAGFGIENIGGRGHYLGLELGLNRQLITYRNDHLGKYYLNAEVGNQEVEYLSVQGERGSSQKAGCVLEGGRNFPGDFRLGLHLEQAFLFSSNYEEENKYYVVGIRGGVNRQNANFSATKGFFLLTGIDSYFPHEITRYSAKMGVYLPIQAEKVVMALQMQGSTQKDGFIHDYHKLSLYGIDGVRSPFHPEMLGNALLQLNIELRINLLKKAFFIDTLQGIGFIDWGVASPNWRQINPEQTAQFAVGTGLRLYIGAPVYLPLRLEVGWDREWSPQFFFAISKPF